MNTYIDSTTLNLKIITVRLLMLMAIAVLFSSSQAFAAPPETMTIWRAQIFFETFNTPDAGSDDSVRVELNSSNGTWVDSGFDDWEIGSRTYDLRLDGITRVSDIDYLRISKTGSGGWCIGRIRLIINGVALYDEQFPNGHWLDNSGGHSTVYFMDDYFMRQRAQWINYVVPTRSNTVPVGDMRSRIQCLFGDYLTYSDDLGFRNSNPIAINTLDANTWRVNVDLDDKKPGPVPDPDIDVDFDLTVSWSGTFTLRPALSVQNLHVGYTWPGYGEPARTFMNNDFLPRLNAMMKNFTYLHGTGIQLAPNGDLLFLPIVIAPGPIVTFSTLTLEQEPPTQAGELSKSARLPLQLRIRTTSDIKPSEETAFTAVVESNLKEDADVDVTFELPEQVFLADAVIVASDGTAERRLSPVVESQSNGATSITLRDRVVAGKETTYSLPVIFRPGEERAALINTRVVTDGRVSPLSATTYFRFDSGAVRSEGTVVKR